MIPIRMEGVREYCEGMPVELVQEKDQRWGITAYNEAGYNSTHIDLHDLIIWILKNKPEILWKALYDHTVAGV